MKIFVLRCQPCVSTVLDEIMFFVHHNSHWAKVVPRHVTETCYILMNSAFCAFISPQQMTFHKKFQQRRNFDNRSERVYGFRTNDECDQDTLVLSCTCFACRVDGAFPGRRPETGSRSGDACRQSEVCALEFVTVHRHHQRQF